MDYAFESHPVLSPVHRVSVSISPYLFSHPEKPTPVEHRVDPVRETVEQDVSVEAEEKSSLDPEKATPEGTVPDENPVQPEEGADESKESSDEVLYNAPAGGVYWEE